MGVIPGEALLPQYLYLYFLNTDMRELGGGSSIPQINNYDIEPLTIEFPESLQEQRRIFGILDEAFEGIATAKANAKKNLQNARALFTAAFGAIAGGSEQEYWLKTTVAAAAAPRKGSIRTGPFGSQLLHSEFVDKGIAVLGIDNAVANEFRWGKDRFITPAKYRLLERYRVHPGDVLITIMGTCGRCAIVPDDIPVAINTKHLCCITLDRSKCLPGYLHAYFLYHPLAQEFLSKHAKGAIMAGLNMGLIEELPLLLPSLERQRKIVATLDSLKEETDRLATIYQQKLAALDELKKSLLHQAFSGEL
jgi:type I restriction enzyme S subunit